MVFLVFSEWGEPFELIEELVRQNQQDLTLVSVVTSQPGKEVGVGRLLKIIRSQSILQAHGEHLLLLSMIISQEP